MGQLGRGVSLGGDRPHPHVQWSYHSWCVATGPMAARGGTVVAARTADRHRRRPVAGRVHNSMGATGGLDVLQGLLCAG